MPLNMYMSGILCVKTQYEVTINRLLFRRRERESEREGAHTFISFFEGFIYKYCVSLNLTHACELVWLFKKVSLLFRSTFNLYTVEHVIPQSTMNLNTARGNVVKVCFTTGNKQYENRHERCDHILP